MRAYASSEKAAQNTAEAYKLANERTQQKLAEERKRYNSLVEEASELNDRIYFLENQNERSLSQLLFYISYF